MELEPGKEKVKIENLFRLRIIWMALVGLGTLYAAFWVYRLVVAQLGPFAPLVAILAAGLIIAIAGPYLLVHYHMQLHDGIVSGVDWLRLKLLATGIPHFFSAHYPRLTSFLQGRLTRNTATGLGLTLSLLVAGTLIWFFITLLIAIVSGSPLVGDDLRIINLVATLRTPTLDRVMFTLSYLGNSTVIGVLAALAALISLLWRRYEIAALLVISLVGSSLLFTFIKWLVGRERPPLEDAQLVQANFSFPSGHSTISATFYGTLACLLLLSLKRDWLKVLVGFLASILVLGIGISRVYLGVHYPSDVLGGWLVGLFWLVLFIIARRVWSLQAQPPTPPLGPGWRKVRVIISFILVFGAAYYLASLYPALTTPALPTLPEPIIKVTEEQDLPNTLILSLPHYSESLFGTPEEPINLVLVGSQARLEAAFLSAGWIKAQKQGSSSLGGAVLASITGHPDPAGPVTPAFLADKPNNLAFSQPVGQNFSKRHHIRIWSTSVQTNTGKAVWLATASYDEGFELAMGVLPTHQIAPDIDTERDYIVTNLRNAGQLSREESIAFVPPQLGHNFAGDPFFTYGMAAVLWLN